MTRDYDHILAFGQYFWIQRKRHIPCCEAFFLSSLLYSIILCQNQRPARWKEQVLQTSAFELDLHWTSLAQESNKHQLVQVWFLILCWFWCDLFVYKLSQFSKGEPEADVLSSIQSDFCALQPTLRSLGPLEALPWGRWGWVFASRSFGHHLPSFLAFIAQSRLYLFHIWMAWSAQQGLSNYFTNSLVFPIN